jgi:arylformamidase
MRTIAPLFLLCVASPLAAAEPKVYRDLAYTEPKNERQTLDVYAPTEGKNHPVIVWIHGGGWRQGDKKAVQKKPKAFTDKGFVFVSINYRLVPKAIRWVHDHAQEYGGDPTSIFVMGHSAGAHMAALVCTDDRYLKTEGLPLSIIKGCVPVDTAAYDVEKQIASAGPARAAVYSGVFGTTALSQKEVSPVTFVAKDKNTPPFLILHVADRSDSQVQSQLFADKLEEAGISAQVVAAEGKTHGTINSDLGLADDKPTKELFLFLGRTLKK